MFNFFVSDLIVPMDIETASMESEVFFFISLYKSQNFVSFLIFLGDIKTDESPSKQRPQDREKSTDS